MEMISQGTVISNPTHLRNRDEILKKKSNSADIPSDYLNF